MTLNIYISGVNSDEDPSPGVGIAKSLRDGFPDASLWAVDYSVRSSGLHHPVFDHVLVQPAWSELDLECYATQVRNRLQSSSACWISGLDVESNWLAEAAGDEVRLLVPGPSAQEKVRKPHIPCAKELDMRVPEFLPADATPSEIHSLGRRSGWQLWIKGRFHEAYPADSYKAVVRQLSRLQEHWPVADIFIQQHVQGLERSYTFAAFQGQLLGAVEVEKRSVTARGKTWAASVRESPGAFTERLSSLAAEVGWSGGGEVEFVRTIRGEDWLIDFNPRFPAYIYGVTICGHNLPSLVVSAACERAFENQLAPAQQFIRVVQELPVRASLPLPRLISGQQEMASGGKHPSLQPELVKRLAQLKKSAPGSKADKMEAPTGSPTRGTSVLEASILRKGTPSRHRDETWLLESLDRLSTAIRKCDPGPRVVPALSIKTDPCKNLAEAFLENGWWAEVISIQELQWAMELGFEGSRIVFNGPTVPELVNGRYPRIAVAFADSCEALGRLLEESVSEVVGLRVRPGGLDSRFGIDLECSAQFKRVAELLRNAEGRPLGIHTHFASDVCGIQRWSDVVEHMLIWASALSDSAGVRFSVVDLGGGWHPDDFDSIFLPQLPSLQTRVLRALEPDTMLLEPGKALSSYSAYLSSSVLEVRAARSDGSLDIVVDASIADLPMAAHYPHRILQFRGKTCLGALEGGRSRVLGAICMENDILAEAISFPAAPKAGDVLLFGSAGGYNASMAWDFARGSSRDV